MEHAFPVADQILASLPLPACVISKDGLFVRENSLFLSLTGYEQTLNRLKALIETHEIANQKNFIVSEFNCDDKQCLLIIVSEHLANEKMLALELAARTDGLTGLYNQIAFKEILRNRINHLKMGELGQNNNQSLVLMIIDMDGFKAINDTHGHLAGDAALQDFATKLKCNTRSTDVVCRIGGDEFAIIVCGVFDDAVRIANRIETRHLVDFDGKALEYGCSVGIASCGNGHTYESLIAQADTIMYDRKKHKKAINNPKTHNRYAALSINEKLHIKMPFPLTADFVEAHTIKNIEHTQIKPSEIHGFGLFATQDLPMHKTLCKLTGQIMTKPEYKKLVESLTPVLGDLSFYFLMECNHIGNPDLLMVRSFRTYWSYINHSIEPNCFFEVRTQQLYPLRNIKRGEELTFDYRVEPLDSAYLEANSNWINSYG